MTQRRILLVTKVPLIERLSREAIARLDTSGAMTLTGMRESAQRQREAVDQVRRALVGHDVRERRVPDLIVDDAAETDLVITAGGDGTVFTANTLATHAPFLTVNSDPHGSLGHFTRAKAEDVPALLAAWLAGTCQFDELPRLRLRTASMDLRVLNDALFTNMNPAAMSRYRIDDGVTSENQRSSGVWVSTAAGSTGGIHSAGFDPVPALTPALLFKVREPFHAFGRLCVLEGRQLPPCGLKLTAAVPGMALYIDGPNITVALAPGETAELSAAPDPLRVVARIR
ncbi:MAG: NAD(+)/NADH kinase [Planctomycetota bacterium]